MMLDTGMRAKVASTALALTIVAATGASSQPLSSDQGSLSWRGWIEVPENRGLDSAPSPIIGAGRLFLVGKGTDEQTHLNVYSLATGEWNGWEALPGTTNVAPAIAFGRGKLHVLAKGIGDHEIYLNVQTVESGEWSGWALVPGGQKTDAALSAKVVRGTLYLLAKGNGDARIHFNSMKLSTGTWSGWSEVPGGVATDAALSTARFGKNLYLFAKKASDQRVLVNTLDTTTKLWSGWSTVPGNQATGALLAAARRGKLLHVFASGDDERIYTATLRPSAGAWSQWQPLPNATTDEAPGAVDHARSIYLVAKGVAGSFYLNIGTQPTPSSDSFALSGTLVCRAADGGTSSVGAMANVPLEIKDPGTNATIGSGVTKDDGSFSVRTDTLVATVRLRVTYDAQISGDPMGELSPPVRSRLQVMDDVHNTRADEVDRSGSIDGGEVELGQVELSTVDCELWQLGTQVVKDYHRVRRSSPPAGELRVMRRAAVNMTCTSVGCTGTPYTSYDHVILPTNFTEIYASSIARRETLFHEFGHSVAFVSDGSRSYWDFNVIRWAYARNHSDDITNVQYAFMEGWARYWEQARSSSRARLWSSHAADNRDWNERLVANRLLELSEGTGVDDDVMVEVLERNPGAIHSLHEFEVQLAAYLNRPAPPPPPSCPPGYTDDGATCRRGDIIAKPSYSRGVGRPVSSCPAGEELDAWLCYPQCSAGYDGVGPVCWEICPEGFADDPATCRRDAHIFGKDNFHLGWGSALPCDDDEEQDGWLCYPRCPAGYDRFADRCWQSECPEGYHDDGATCRKDADIFWKDSYTRGAGSPMGCSSSEEYDAGLCYAPCSAGYHGAGPICWGTCPAGYADHIATCYIETHVILKF